MLSNQSTRTYVIPMLICRTISFSIFVHTFFSLDTFLCDSSFSVVAFKLYQMKNKRLYLEKNHLFVFESANPWHHLVSHKVTL